MGPKISLYHDILCNSIDDAFPLKLETNYHGVHHTVASYRKCEESKASYPSSEVEEHNPSQKASVINKTNDIWIHKSSKVCPLEKGSIPEST